MLNVNYNIEYGVIHYTQRSDLKRFTIKIHWANALCAFIYHYKTDDGKKLAQLVSFFADEQHLKNCEKSWNGDSLGFISDVGIGITIRLNVYYKESMTLLKHFTKAGYKVTCYYKEPKTKK